MASPLLEKRRRFWGIFLLLLLLLFALVLLSPLVGPVKLNLRRVFDLSVPLPENADASIFLFMRLPRVLLAVVAGTALAAAGATFQALLRNPLATPYILGVSGGSSFAVVLALHLNLHLFFLGYSSITIIAFMGALGATALVYLLARMGGGIATLTLILGGVTANFLFASLIMLVQFLSSPAQTHQMISWMMGGVGIQSYAPLLQVTPLVLLGLFVLVWRLRDLSLLSLGELEAHVLGVDVAKAQRFLLAAASLLTAAVVSVCGPIGFVGLVTPHMVRMTLSADYRFVIPLACLLGSIFLLAADTLGRTVFSPLELPAGVITAITGAPFFLYILVRRRI